MPLPRRALLATAALLLREAAAQAGQQIPNANSPSDSSSSSSSALGLPLPALIVVIIVGAALALLAAYQLYRLTWRIRHKPAPLPTARSLLTPGTPLGTPVGTATRNTGRSLSMLLQQEQESPGVMWEHGTGASGVFAGMQAAHQRASTASTAATTPGDALPFPGTPGGTEWERWSPLSPDFSVGGNRTSSLTLPNAPFSSHPRDGSGGRSSVYSLPGGHTPPEGGRPTRRSVYAMSLYSTPHFPSSGASGSTSGGYTPPGSTRLAARTNPNRISGAPHHSQIEIVPPAPLGPPPGTVVADTKSTLNFTAMSGVGAEGGQDDWFKRVSSGAMAPGTPVEDDPLMAATPRSPEVAHFASSAPQTPLSAGFGGFAGVDRRSSVASSAVLRDAASSPSRSRPSSSGVLGDGYGPGPSGAHGMSRSESEISGGSSFAPGGPFRDPSLTVAGGTGGFEGLQGAFATPSGSSRPESVLGESDESDSTRGRGRAKERPLRHSSVDGEVTMVAEPTSPLEALQDDMKRRARKERRRAASGEVLEDQEPTEKIRSRPPSVHLADLLDRDVERERELHEDR